MSELGIHASALDLGYFPSIPLGNVLKQSTVKVNPSLYDPLSVGQQGVTTQLEGVALQQDDAEKKLVEPGDIVINSRSDRRGASGLSSLTGVVSVINTVLKVEPEFLDQKYAAYTLKSTAFQDEFYRWGTGIVDDLWSTKYDRMSQIRIPLPPLETQRRIADYLDRETSEIDEMVRALDEYLALLVDRQALLIDAVLYKDTRGQNGDSPRNLLAPIWHYASVNPMTVEFSNIEDGEVITFLPLEAIWPFRGSDLSQTKTFEKKESSYTRFKSGDILVPKVSPTVFHGRATVADGDFEVGWASSEVHVLRAHDWVDRDWLTYVFLSRRFLDSARANVFGVGGLQRVSARFISSFKVPKLDTQAQREHVSMLDSQILENRQTIDMGRSLRSLLLKRRQVLINDVVTGKKQV